MYAKNTRVSGMYYNKAFSGVVISAQCPNPFKTEYTCWINVQLDSPIVGCDGERSSICFEYREYDNDIRDTHYIEARS